MKIEAIEYNLEIKKLNGIELDSAYLDILEFLFFYLGLAG